ncbi:hypothetical protein D9Q98_005133 [Chlorella vulgaris]|uniref:BZIP domain-containing protein n=1 Tax=Chlorella vulgaris TaxID=3077 RepID=A0A9D4YWN7_CHLVU|nr:hypothetical protein D9Q98_005133 [Chlorella vulgaris]
MAHPGAAQQGPVVSLDNAAAAVPGIEEWDLDVDAFLDDYLKDLGPQLHAPDAFGNFGIDFALSGGVQQSVLGAWGPSAPAPAPPVAPSSPVLPAPGAAAAQQQGTMLTSQLQAQGLNSQAPSVATQLPLETGEVEMQQPTMRVTRTRKAAAAAAGAAASASVGARTASGGSRGGGGGRGTARETKKDQDMKKHLALQEKNRRAQRRFRERQKQRVAELEEQVECLKAQLAAATAAGGQPAQQHEAAAAPQLQPAPSADFMQQDDVKAEVATDASPRTVVGAQGPATTSSLPATGEDGSQAVKFPEALTLTVRQGQPLVLGGRELADMTPAELARHYKAYVTELATLLVSSDNPAANATQERVRVLVDEVCLLCTRTALCNPPGSKHFALTKVDDVSNQPADTRIPQISRALDINQHQRRQLGQLRSLFLQKLARVAAERRGINAQLAGAVPGGTGSRHLACCYLAAHESQRRLRQSLWEEHHLVLDFVSTIYKHVFTSHQVAQFMIQAYPWTPDCLALCTWVAAEDGDAEALSMLAAEAQSKQAAAQAAAQAGSNVAGPPTSGGSGNGNSSHGGGAAGTTPTHATLAPPGGGGSQLFLPFSFGSGGLGQQQQQQQQQQPDMAGLGAFHPLMHMPTGGGGGTDALPDMMDQFWGGSSLQSGLQLPAGTQMLGAATCAQTGLPLSPHVAMSSANGP